MKNRKLIKDIAKVLLMVIITTLALSTVSCSLLPGIEPEQPDNKPQSKKFPEYADDREMLIGGWDSPLNTLEDIQIAKDMGLTHMFLGQNAAKRGTEAYEAALRLYEQVGLKVIVQTTNAFTSKNDPYDPTDYSQFPAVDFINYWDEPYYSTIDVVAELVKEHYEKYGNTGIGAYGNLLPNSATGAFEGHSFKEYVEKWTEEVLMLIPEEDRWLSIDLYPLEERNGQAYMRSNWLGCIEAAALQAKKSNAKVHFFLQATEHYNYRAVKEEDIRFQFYVNMAFGVQGFSYFTYGDSFLADFEHSCVSRDGSGTIHDTYYMAQTVNNEIKAFDHVYLNYEWQGTLPIIGKNNEGGYNTNFDGLTNSLETLDVCNRWDATEDALIGVFKDADGNDGLIVTNFTDPAYRIDNLVRFDFKDVTKIRVYRGGVAYDYEVLNNRFDLELAPGEGVFMILLSDR